MKNKTLSAGCVLLLTAALFAGCGGGSREGADDGIKPSDGPNGKPSTGLVGTDPVTLKLYNTQTLNDEDFQRLFADPVKKKYPNISIEFIKPGQGSYIEDLIAAGTVPDLITTYNGQILEYEDNGLLQDMTPLIKKHNIDLARFEPVIIDSIKTASDKGELYALPYVQQFKALYYNKDIFDKFGVPYPQDGMTWPDAMELAKKLSRKEGEVQYRGLDFDNVHRLSTARSLDLIDAKAQKAHLNIDDWKMVFELGKEIYSVPGNMPKKPGSGSVDEFFKDKNLAMLATINYLDKAKDGIQSGLKLGVAQYPSFTDKSDIFGMVDAQVIFVPKQSKHQDEAMEVIATLTSDEVQLISARQTARNSPLKDKKFQQQFAADMDYLKGIDLSPIFKSHSGPAPAFSKYYAGARKILESTFRDYVLGQIPDVNSALRQGDEQINQMIADSGKADKQ